jgi:hypothetical protein
MANKFLRQRLISTVAPARSLAPAKGSKQVEQFPRTTYHKIVKVWASLEEVGSPLATGKDFSRHRLV